MSANEPEVAGRSRRIARARRLERIVGGGGVVVGGTVAKVIAAQMDSSWRKLVLVAVIAVATGMLAAWFVGMRLSRSTSNEKN